MMSSILNTTKKILGIDFSYRAFDTDIVTHINATFATLNQLGVGPVEGITILGPDEDWEDYDIPANQLGLIKSYVYLKVRMYFDPPTTSFLLTAMENQLKELEWRISEMREDTIPYVPTVVVEEEVVI